MTTDRDTSTWLDPVRGAVAGAVGTYLMDMVTIGVKDGQSKAMAKRERSARPHGKSAVANLVDSVEDITGMALSRKDRSMVESTIHLGLGVLPGAVYGAVRRRLPGSPAARGLAYGIALWAVNDEILNTALGLSGPVEAYPAETHWRGLLGHAVLGVATETGIELLGG